MAYRWRRPFDYGRGPRRARGGIQPGAGQEFATTWWGKRWAEAIERAGGAARFARGRSYARRGQVIHLVIDKGIVRAEVQGSRNQPYAIEIQVPQLRAAAWNRAARSLAARADLLARILTDELPIELDALFQEQEAPLLPRGAEELRTRCTCPDWTDVCKHVSAVAYLIALEIDRDPFLLLKLRGRDRDEFRALAGGSESAPVEAEEAPAPPEPLPPDASVFWGVEPAAAGVADGADSFRVPEVPAPLARRLGRFPLWRGRTDLVQVLADVARSASQHVRDLLQRRGSAR